ncbi:TAP-like protein-domain-containing protein [Desarmillaria tabescens]|uniref:TAP-like protein-domain-containing protein n=1 Tax=Armillaria tabescens TaxID=1929756 RepID=A0AA39KAD0_ARMTA|nr:TAP-like protein-domain-containing protein [Desarmillaria tabescens]KAK0457514.1 TAP-like protein-domain-containing protein [Desarmillaria tabescens]
MIREATHINAHRLIFSLQCHLSQRLLSSLPSPFSLVPPSSCFLQYWLKSLSIGGLLNRQAIYHGSTATLATNAPCFQVPIDYLNEDGNKASLAVIKFSAHSKTESKGSVLMNPGGPGGSGVAALALMGPLLASVIGNQYDFISFDPRGVGNSTPRAEFFLSKEEHSQWLANPNPELAKDRDNGILNHMTTDNSARDMLWISEAKGQEKLQYLGLSYGIVLGTTFATMFPDKVQRMAWQIWTAYYRNDLRNQIADTDKVMQSFFDACVAAGPDACAFHAPTSDAISKQFDSLYESLLIQPIPVSELPLSQPYRYFSVLAQGLADIAAARDGSIIYGMQAMADASNNTDSAADLLAYWDSIKDLSTLSDYTFYPKNQLRVMDGNSIVRADLRVRFFPQTSLGIIVEYLLIGPVTGNTSYPILFIRNTADPLTPLSMARKTSSAFPGSVVLAQNSSGHTSLFSLSTCTHAYIQAYFQNGTLPADGTVCEIESEMFPTSSITLGRQ